MEGDLRQGSGSTNMSTNTTVSGTGININDENVCGYSQIGAEVIQVEQVLGAEMSQKVVEADMLLPAPKPDIEQVIDVYVKNVEINSIDVINNKMLNCNSKLN